MSSADDALLVEDKDDTFDTLLPGAQLGVCVIGSDDDALA